ncbi:hypothetical protein [Negadavirga shengliensis]|uniref:Lipoprotein n=1 Tax=Negadavirga shengliensis TaxID=1389218 RepID=A0ABV9SXM9_9BACT
MNKIIYTSFVTLMLSTLFSCDNNKLDHQKYMTLDSLEYVLEFPNEFVIHNKKETGIDLVGVWDFAIQDSIMILSTRKKNGVWKFLSLPEYHHLGDFLHVGEGPLELSSSPSVSDKVKITKENNRYHAYIYDFGYGKLLKLDINQSIKHQELFISTINDSLPQYLFDFLVIDTDTYFCKEIGNMETQQFRYLLY